MKYKRYNFDTFTVHTVKTDKFKDCVMEIILRKPIKKEEITKWNFLTDMLTYTSKKYPKRRDLAIEFENLYNTSVRGVPSRIGESYSLSIITNFLNPKYCDEGILKKIIELPFELLLNPNVENDEFDIRSFNIVKNRTKADLESLREIPSRYALRQSLVKLDDKSPVSYSMSGYTEDLDKITPSNLYKIYLELFKSFQCDIFVVGNLDMDEVVNIITNKFTNQYVKNFEISLYSNPKIRKRSIEVRENGDYEQANLVMLYNLEDLNKRERDIITHIYNFILGGGSISTKLGKYLREDNGLCYSTGSMYQKYDKLLMIYAGIDGRNFKKAVRLVKRAIKDMAEGNFSEQELSEAKLALVSSLRMGQDSIGSILNNYLFNYLDDLPLFESRMELIMDVTKEEVVALAKKVRLNLVYLLDGGGDDNARNKN